jgi:uncharacterized membrane protein YkoI
MKRAISSLTFAVGACLVAGAASADPFGDLFYPADSNGVLLIDRILDQARASMAGMVTEIEHEHEHGKLIYEVEILTSDGRKVEIKYDARSGAELSREIRTRRTKKED